VDSRQKVGICFHTFYSLKKPFFKLGPEPAPEPDPYQFHGSGSSWAKKRPAPAPAVPALAPQPW